MRVTSVESTTLSRVVYDEARQQMSVEFRSRAVYLYFGVAATVHEALLEAPSKGRYFNRTIRGRFRFDRIGECYAEAAEAPGRLGAAAER